MTELIVFLILSIPLLILSRRSILNPKKHGLYRFITWESALWIGIQNHQYQVGGGIDLRISAASILTMSSLALVISALVTMRRHGRISRQRKDETLFDFEKTTELVTSGLFRYIRHPMYTSLLCLIWGFFFRAPHMSLLIVALVGSLACYLAAVIEEQENLEFFGEQYREYMRRSKRFIPFLF